MYKDKYGVNTTLDNKEVVEFSDVIYLAIKPQFYKGVLEEIKDVVTPAQIIVTIAPGKKLEWMAEKLGGGLKIIRTMPNTPAMVKEGMITIF